GDYTHDVLSDQRKLRDRYAKLQSQASTEAEHQISLLTKRIKVLQKHLAKNPDSKTIPSAYYRVTHQSRAGSRQGIRRERSASRGQAVSASPYMQTSATQHR
ncbi:ribosomal protein S15, partial [Kipferlia bialata]